MGLAFTSLLLVSVAVFYVLVLLMSITPHILSTLLHCVNCFGGGGVMFERGGMTENGDFLVMRKFAVVT
jgi:hypothetical protein